MSSAVNTLVQRFRQLAGLEDRSKSLRAALLTGGFWSLVGTVATRAFTLATNIGVARWLGVAAFGELGLIQSTLSTIGVVSGYGFGLAAARFVARLRNDQPERAGRILTLMLAGSAATTLLGAGLLVAMADWVWAYLHLASPTPGQVASTATLLVASSVLGVLQSALMGFQRFKAVAANNVVYGVCVLCLSLVLAPLFGLDGALWAYATASVAAAVHAARDVRSVARADGVPLLFEWDQTDMRVVFTFTLPAVLSGLLVLPVTWWTSAQAAALPGGDVQLGLFNAANQWRNLVLFVPQAFGGVSLTLLSQAYSPENAHGFRKALLVMLASYFVPSSVVALGLIVTRQVVMGVYGPEFVHGATVLVLMAATGVVQSLASGAGQVIASSGRMWWGVLFNGIWAVAAVVAVRYLVVPTAEGLGWSFLGAYTLLLACCLLAAVLLERELGLRRAEAGPESVEV